MMGSDGLTLDVAARSQEAAVAVLAGEAGQPQEKGLDGMVATLSGRPERLLVLDVSGVTFISSVGLRTIMAVRQNRQAAGRQTVLAAVPERVMGVLRRCKLEGQFVTHGTVEAALADGADRR